MKRIKEKQLLGAFLGTIVEYYDYSLYGFSAAIIADKFFPAADPLINLMHAFAVYAVGYLSKPFGILLFGYIGDKYGRKLALNSTILGIAIPTMVIGTLPDYTQIGMISTVILIACRILQGIFVAGEYDGAAIYVIEHLGEKYSATASAVTRATGVIGLLLGIGATNFFNAHVFPQWSWRIPFLLSMPLSFLALYCRKQLREPQVFIQSQKININSFKNVIKKYWYNIILAALLAGASGATYQVAIIFTKQYLPIILPQTKLIISSFSVLLVFCFGFSMPIAGFFADRLGQIYVIRTAAIGTFFAGVLFIVAVEYEMINLALGASLLLAACIAPFNALVHSIIINSFPVNARYRGIGIGHTLGSMLMSGSANYICLIAIKYLEMPLFPIIYIIFLTALIYIIAQLYR